MIIEYIRYKVEPSQSEEFIEAYRKAAEQLNRSAYCIAYELSECEEERGQFLLRIEWTSTEEHLNGFRKSDVFPEFFSNIKQYFNNIQEMRHYRQTGLVHRKS
jgi:quinol monooxygenase YgiN